MARRATPRVDDDRQADLFVARYQVRAPRTIKAADFDTRLRRAVSDALLEARTARDKSRSQVAAEMAEWLGNPKFSEYMLNQFAAESNETHNINVKTFKALALATECLWLYDLLIEDEGCILLYGDEARDAELGLVKRQMAALKRKEKQLLGLEPAQAPRGRRS